MMLNGVYEPDVTAVIQHNLTSDAVFLDIGANVGYYTMIAAGVARQGRVIAVEPSLRDVRAIRRSLALNGFDNVQVINATAMSDWRFRVRCCRHQWHRRRPSRRQLRSTPCRGFRSTAPPGPAPAGPDQDRRRGRRARRAGRPAHDHLEAEAEDRVGVQPPALIPISGVTGEQYLEMLLDHGDAVSVIQADGTTSEAHLRAAPIMAAFTAVGSDHIDLFATPAPR